MIFFFGNENLHNDYLINVLEEPVPKKKINEDKYEVIDCCDEKSPNSNETHKYKVNDCSDEKTINSNEESTKKKEINTIMTNITSVEPNSTILYTTPTKHATLKNPYNNNKKNIISTGNITITKNNDDSFSMSSVPEVVNLAKDGNVVSPFSLSDQKSSVVHHDLGINIISSPTVASLGINVLPKRSNYYQIATARIRCAYINGDETQSVVFFFEELTLNSYFAQSYFLTQLQKNKWLQKFLPWEIPGINSDVFKLFVNNKFVQGKEQGHGYTLFIYTHGVPAQNRDQIKATAYKFCAIVQKIVKNKQNVIVDDDKFFLHNGACVWSNIINQTACVQRLSIEANDMIMNDSLKVRNPKFWDKHEKIIRKYYNPRMLTVELAIKYNAPLDEIDPSIILTPELIEQTRQRRLLINTFQDTVQDELPSNIDPTTQVNYNISPNEININTDNPSHEELADFVNNLGNFD